MFYFFLALLLNLSYLTGDPFLPDAPPERQFSPSTNEHLIGGFVNPATGQFSLSVTDLIAKGAEPLHLTRHYYPPIVKRKYDKDKWMDRSLLDEALRQRFGWIFFPHILATLQHIDSKGRAIITITEPDGSRLKFKLHKSGKVSLESPGPFTNSNGQ